MAHKTARAPAPRTGGRRETARARAPPPPRAGGGVGEAPLQLQELWPPRQAREAALPPPGRRKPMLYLHEASKAYSASDSLIHGPTPPHGSY